MCYKTLCLVLLLGVSSYGQNEDESNAQLSAESSWDVLKNQHQAWRAIEMEKDTEWTPQEEEQVTEIIKKRRRLRKRKRRPTQTESAEFPSESDSREATLEPINIQRKIKRVRKRRPQRLYQQSDIMERQMVQEFDQKPTSRRRVPPVYQSSSEEIITDPFIKVVSTGITPLQATISFADPSSEEIIRDPLTALQEEEEKQKKTPEPLQTTTTLPDLKTLLKQSSGTLSLSEILQQKNLSLAELLRGNKNAISALTKDGSRDDTISEEQDFKSKRLPPSISLNKEGISRNYEQIGDSAETLTSRETLEAQRKRLTLLHAHKENKIYSDVNKFEVVTEPTTEKRIFVSTDDEFDEPTSKATETKTIIPELTTETANTIISTNPHLRKLPITSARLLKNAKIQSNVRQVTLPPIKPYEIDLNEVFGVQNIRMNLTKVNTSENEPMRLQIELNIPTTTTEKTTTTTRKPSTTKPTVTTTSTVKPKTNVKLNVSSAKDEIMEILKDPLGRIRLSRILQVRNMTIEELIQQRERGSSQLHLADIFHNDTLEPEPKEELFIDQINTEVPVRKQKSQKLDPVVPLEISTTSLAPVKEIEVAVEVYKRDPPSNILTVTSFPTVKIEVNKTQPKPQNFFPHWKNILPDLMNTLQDTQQPVRSVQEIENDFSQEEIHVFDMFDNNLSKLQTLSNFNLDDDKKIYNLEQDNFINLPVGVKSALIASFAIVVLSLVVFLTILVIFKWSQRRKKNMLNYSSSLTACKVRSPILEAPHKNLRSFVCETFGRSKNYYKSHRQSMSDNIWENNR